MKEILELFILDWKRIIKSPVSLVIICGLMLIPSLYAWFNIMALWDPYGSTSTLPIGVYSADESVEIEDTTINIGQEIIDNLHENEDIAWQFATSEKAVDEGVNSGEYYAGIVIPKSFTNDLIEYIQDDSTDKPQINYFVNEKINAIAPKITDEGVSSIQEEVSQGFVGTVAEALTSAANDLGYEMQDDSELYARIIDLINTAYGDLDDLAIFVSLINDLDTELTKLKPQVDALSNYDQVSDSIYELSSSLDQFVTEQASVNASIESDYNTFMSNDELFTYLEELNSFNDNLIEQVNTYNQDVNNSIDQLNEFKESYEAPEDAPEAAQDVDEKVDIAIEKLTSVNANLNEAVTNLNGTKSEIDNFETDVANTSSDITSLYQDQYLTLSADLAQISDSINNSFPTVDEQVKADIAKVQSTYPEIQASLSDLNDNLQVVWPMYEENITQLHTKVNEEELDFAAIEELLLINPKRSSDLMSNPINIRTTLKYHVPNYGSQSAPFYTALCLWVGAVLLTSVLSTKFHLDGGVKGKYTIRKQHLGRMLTFISIAIIQALIVSIGNIYLLGTYTVDPLYNVICAVFIAICFNIIVYTLASLFDNIGKAIAVVLLVLSVAGGGGNFPIQLSSEFFQFINPLLPFTHAVNLLRETVGGIYIPTFNNALLILFIDSLAVLIVGTLLAPKAIQLTEKLMRKTDSSHIFH